MLRINGLKIGHCTEIFLMVLFYGKLIVCKYIKLSLVCLVCNGLFFTVM